MQSTEQPVASTGSAGDKRSSALLRKTWQDLEARTRRSPAEYLILAFFAGTIVHVFPLRALLVLLVRIATALAGPAVVFLGLRAAVQSFAVKPSQL